MGQKQQHNKPSRFLDVVREKIRLRHLSYKTEQHYLGWIKRFILFHKKQHPELMAGEPEISAFLSHLAVAMNCSPSTQNQALNALVFLFRNVLDRNLGVLKSVTWARRRQHVPTVMTREEVRRVLEHLQVCPPKWLIGCLLYGCGLRLSEALRLRVKDVDFAQGILTIRDAKGGKDRVVPLPKKLAHPLREQIAQSEVVHEKDLQEGFGKVSLPYALARKYPNADKEWIWQYVFPSTRRAIDPRSGIIKRHHIFDTYMESAVKLAASQAGLMKRVTCHTFRHSFATHLLENGRDIRLIQELLGHSDVRTTMIYTHVAQSPVPRVVSPFDEL